VAIDTAFAMAYRKLAVEYWNRSFETQAMEYVTRSYRHRDRLSDAERYLTIAGYYQYGPEQDQAKVVSAFEALLDFQPDNATALNNVAVTYQLMRQYDKAKTVVTRAADLPDAPAVVFNNLGTVSIHFGDTAQVERAIATLQNRFGRNAFSSVARMRLRYGLGQRDSAKAIGLELLRPGAADPETRSFALLGLGAISEIEGRVRDAGRYYADGWDLQVQRGARSAVLQRAASAAWLDAWMRGDVAGARRRMERAIAEQPLASIPPIERPYAIVAAALALVGSVEQAKSVVALHDQGRRTLKRGDDERMHATMLADIAVAERRYDDAIREYRNADAVNACIVCTLPRLAHAYDLAGRTDSAIAAYRRFLETRDGFRLGTPRGGPGADGDFLTPAHKRLAELLEARGDKQEALGYYMKFVDLWKNADPELQPQVADVRRRIARLKDTEAR
jgi:tetratricopeptide (TPR) repeat protein